MPKTKINEELLRAELEAAKERIAELEAYAARDACRGQHSLKAPPCQTLLDALATPVFCKDTEGRYLSCNKTFEEFMRLPRAEILGKTAYDLAPKELADTYTAMDRRLFQDGGVQVYESQILDKAGELRRVQFKKTLFLDASGAVGGIVGVILDITERKLAEEALKESENRFRQVFDNMADGMAVYRAVDDGNDFVFVSINQAGQLLSELSEKQAMGRRVTELFPGVAQLGLLDAFRRVWRTGTAERLPLKVYEDRRIKQWVENYVFKLPSGLIVALYSDTTLQRKAEEALQESFKEAKDTARTLSAMFEASQAVLEFQDFPTAARHIFDSCAALIGATAGYVALLSADGQQNEVLFMESGGRPCVVNPELPMPFRVLRALACSTISAAFDNDFSRSQWMQYIPKGHVALDNVLFAPLVLEGKTLGVIGLANKPGGFSEKDVKIAQAFGDLAAIALRNARALENLSMSKARHREARIAAESASKAKSEFLANMSHEIRTPLNGVLGMLQLLQTTTPHDEQKEFISAAIFSSRRLTRLLSDILDLSRIEAGKLAIQEAEFELESLKNSIVELFSLPVREKGLHLDFILDEHLPQRLIGDETRLMQILFNLVGNAIKFTSKGLVRAEASLLGASNGAGLRVLFVVSDTGIGIDDDQLKDIFEPFVQAEGSFVRRYQGAGLGLCIVRRLMRLMDGELSIDNAPGQGTTVYLSLPFKLPKSEGKAAIETTAQTALKAPYNVLLAEDDQTSLLLAKRMLEKAGHRVTVALDGKQALRLLAAEEFDLILMDIQMPVMDGVEATRAIRSDAAFADKADIPIVAMTAYALAGDKETFLAAGMDGYIAKPVDMEALRTVIEQAMSKRTRVMG